MNSSSMESKDVDSSGVKRAKTEATIPEGWSVHVDESTGARYYWNAELGTASWERPTTEESDAVSLSNAKESMSTKAKETYSNLVLGKQHNEEKARWIKHSDPETGLPYFVNTENNKTQWEVPEEAFIDATVFAPAVTASSYQDYSTTATFNADTGQFTSGNGQTHWERIGKPNDREGRMVSNTSFLFFTLFTCSFRTTLTSLRLIKIRALKMADKKEKYVLFFFFVTHPSFAVSTEIRLEEV